MRKAVIAAPLLALIVTGCQSVADQLKAMTQSTSDQSLTVAKAQTEIKKGMSGAQVVESLGAPNMVSTDENGNEVWVYDKISTVSAVSESAGGGGLILFGAAGGSGAKMTNQRTLTIIVKFDKNKKVRDFAYQSTSF